MRLPLLVGFEGTEVPPWLASDLEMGRVQGVILFARNLESLGQVEALVDELRSRASACLVAIDQEGGRVQRLRAPFPELPTMGAVGRLGRKTVAGRCGALLAVGLRKLGINVDFAPVLDLDLRPGNAVVGDRSFGAEPALVSRLGAAFVDGLQAAGVAGCAKHFPGHGDTDQDSHSALPTVEADEDTLRRRDLSPFRAAILAEVASVMTAHVRYPAVDERPATRSFEWIERRLRTELGFQGVVFSDDLDMVGFGADVEAGAVEALAAGCDGLLACRRPETVEAIRTGLERALTDGHVSQHRLDLALGRLGHMASAFPPHAHTSGEESWEALAEEAEALRALVQDRASGLDPTVS
ncbi:MAG: beta-N-acetylhexosaminidase [Myxococcota bacterium]